MIVNIHHFFGNLFPYEILSPSDDDTLRPCISPTAASATRLPSRMEQTVGTHPGASSMHVSAYIIRYKNELWMHLWCVHTYQIYNIKVWRPPVGRWPYSDAPQYAPASISRKCITISYAHAAWYYAPISVNRQSWRHIDISKNVLEKEIF